MTDQLVPLVVDTNALIWYWQAAPQLSEAARSAVTTAEMDGTPVFVSAATVVELRRLVEKGTLAEDVCRRYLLTPESVSEAIEVAPVDMGVARAVEFVPRELIGDPFDRMIAATAVALGVPLATADRKLRKLSAVDTIW